MVDRALASGKCDYSVLCNAWGTALEEHTHLSTLKVTWWQLGSFVTSLMDLNRGGSCKLQGSGSVAPPVVGDEAPSQKRTDLCDRQGPQSVLSIQWP